MSRRKARELALQAIYQWQLNTMLVPDILKQFSETNAARQMDVAHFTQLVTAAIDQTPEWDALFTPLLDRPLTDLDPVELALLRLSTIEMKHCLDVPYRVVINEAVELAKKYGSTDGHKYINRILDLLAQQLRGAELS